MAVAAIPSFAKSGDSSGLAVCANNLRQIGKAIQAFVGDYGQAPWRVPVQYGGTYVTSRPANAWYEFTSLSNSLASPRVLSCPSDTGVQLEPDWGRFVAASRGKAVSYNIYPDVLVLNPNSALLAGDRNLRMAEGSSACTAGFNNVNSVDVNWNTTLAWTNAVHGPLGNSLMLDGSVIATRTDTLRLLHRMEADDASVIHIVKAR